MTMFSGVFTCNIKIWGWSAAMLAAIFQPYEKIMFMAFADANNNLLTGPQMNKQNSLLPTNKLSFCCRVETASPIKNTLSEQIPASEYLLLPGWEGRLCAGRVNICHGDETRKSGGTNPS